MTATSTSSSIFDIFLKGFGYFFDFGFIFFPNIGYIHQYIKINKLKSSYGFSKFISFLLIIALIFRIFFWIGKQFSIVILFQSIVGIIMQLVLIKKCVEYTLEYRNKIHSDIFNPNEFWNWPRFLDYFYFVFLVTVVLNLFSILITYNNMFYVETLGAISALVEAMIGLPQIIEICKKKTVKTLSFLMISAWLIGDSIKLFYFLQSKAPLQLVLCGLSQLVVDLIIISQIFYYSRIYKNKEQNVQVM
jgi:uncharacterized protein with PQ loop repeat